MIAGMVVANLLYVVGAIVAATVVSAFVLLRHRRPKSLEAGIEMFSRELKALEPDRPSSAVHGSSTTAYGSGGSGAGPVPRTTAGGGARPRFGGRTVTPLVTSPPGQAPAGTDAGSERDGALAPSPDRENEPG